MAAAALLRADDTILNAGTVMATPGGVTFTAPTGWKTTRSANMVALEAPEGDSRLAFVDVTAPDVDAAVSAAWRIYRPAGSRPLRQKLPQAPQNGWEERYFFEYESSPNERVIVFAHAWRSGPSWLVAIVDVTEGTGEKRAGPISLAVQSLRPKGYKRETFAGLKAHRLDAPRVDALKSFVENGMKELGIPGVGLSLIDRGKAVFVGGFGVKELGKPDKVDGDTLFIAASNTKAMTTLLLAELVDEKKLEWDQPVVEVFPDFKLGNAETTNRVLVRHLVCACTGMPRQDLEWLFDFRNATPSSSVTLLGTMQPTSKFGEVFQYSNLMATVAGYIGGSLVHPGKELGAAYDQAMRDKIFLPLGMKDTTFDFRRAMNGNYARPHGDDVDGIARLGHMDLNFSVIPNRPAGGMWTSARDLSRYVEMELAQGALPDGRRLVSRKNLLARRVPQVLESEDVSYGMGLTIDRRWGTLIIHHGGDLAGYHSDMIWLPDYGVGAVILTNADPGWRLRSPFMRRLLEVLFDGKPEAEQQLESTAQRRRLEMQTVRARLVIPADAIEAGKLAQSYKSRELGDLTVLQDGKETVFDVGEWRSKVATRKNDDGTVSFITIEPTLDWFEFVVGEKDGKRALIIRDAQHEYYFVET